MEELVKVKNNGIIIAEYLIKQITDFEKMAIEIKIKEEELKKQLKEAMEKTGVLSLQCGELKISYRKPSTRTTLDTKKLKEDLPDIYNEYSKTSDVSSSVSIGLE